MKKTMVSKAGLAGVVASFLMAGFLPVTVFASTPQLSVSNEGGYARIVVSNAASYAPITLFTRDQNSSLWSSVINFGTTDNSGYFSNLYRSTQLPFEFYVTVNGVQSSTQQLGYNNNYNCGGYYYCGGNVSLSQTSLSLNVGQSASVSISGSGNYYVSNNSSNVVTASISGSQLNIYGNNSGSATVNICSYSGSSNCASLYVTVGYLNYGNNNVSLSQTSVSLGIGQSSQLTIYGSGSYYISNNSNSTVATASISGSQVTVYGNNYGSTTINICANNYSYSCASLYVTVGSYGGSNSYLTFINTSLPQPQTGSYYSQQLSVSGGTYPYTFTLVSGNLPPGLSLSSGGIISGMTQYMNQSYTFTVQVQDSQWRTASNSFTLSTSSTNYNNYQYPYNTYYQNVLGLSTYSNGAILREGQTLFITYKNTKTPFANAESFLGLGFKFGNAVDATNYGLAQSGRIITTSQAHHPYGSWIKWGSTIYFVSDTGLIPVSSWDIFVSNGGSDIWVVPANVYDTQLYIQSLMTYNDWRLR